MYWNSCSCQVYPITLDARLIYHSITQFFIQLPFSFLELCPITPLRFPLGGSIYIFWRPFLPTETSLCLFERTWVQSILLHQTEIMEHAPWLCAWWWRNIKLLKNLKNILDKEWRQIFTYFRICLIQTYSKTCLKRAPRGPLILSALDRCPL